MSYKNIDKRAVFYSRMLLVIFFGNLLLIPVYAGLTHLWGGILAIPYISGLIAPLVLIFPFFKYAKCPYCGASLVLMVEYNNGNYNFWKIIFRSGVIKCDTCEGIVLLTKTIPGATEPVRFSLENLRKNAVRAKVEKIIAAKGVATSKDGGT